MIWLERLTGPSGLGDRSGRHLFRASVDYRHGVETLLTHTVSE